MAARSAGDEAERRACVLVRGGAPYRGRQGLDYTGGLTGQSAGSRQLSLTTAVVPPGARTRAHLHRGIESAGYVVEGVLETLFGPRLEHSVVAAAGDYVYIPPDIPHVVVNRSSSVARALVAHSAADDQEGIVLLPELDALAGA
jgi:uncharacterized RmlC-like cupin family protein